jgi:hypothetical protein
MTLALAAVCLLAAACGGGATPLGVASVGQTTTTTAPTGRTSPSSPTIAEGRQQKLAYALCMQSHGDSSYPDPSFSNNDKPPANLGALSRSPGYAKAEQACDHLLPDDGSAPGTTETQTGLQDALSYVQCMRTHGIPNMADPTFEGGSLHLSPPAGVNKSSSIFQAAIAACRTLLVGAGGS